MTTNASGFELRIDWNGSFYIGGPLNFYVVFVTIQLSPPACLQVNASNSTLIACNGSATVCTLSLSAQVYPQSMQIVFRIHKTSHFLLKIAHIYIKVISAFSATRLVMKYCMCFSQRCSFASRPTRLAVFRGQTSSQCSFRAHRTRVRIAQGARRLPPRRQRASAISISYTSISSARRTSSTPDVSSVFSWWFVLVLVLFVVLLCVFVWLLHRRLRSRRHKLEVLDCDWAI